MSKVDWFRRTAWTAADREEFSARLNRNRSSGQKAQYLRIQAIHLAEAGYHDGAIELLDRMFEHYPDAIQLAQAHAQKADSLAKIGQPERAIGEYRAALQAERDFPNVRTHAWLDFGWFVVKNALTDFYEEILQALKEFWDEAGSKFPDIEYRYSAIQSLLADARGEKAKACEFAKRALAESAKVHSGLRYHPKVGLVGDELRTFENRLHALADS